MGIECGVFSMQRRWPSIKDALAEIPALQGVGLDAPKGPFYLHNSMFCHWAYGPSSFVEALQHRRYDQYATGVTDLLVEMSREH